MWCPCLIKSQNECTAKPAKCSARQSFTLSINQGAEKTENHLTPLFCLLAVIHNCGDL